MVAVPNGFLYSPGRPELKTPQQQPVEDIAEALATIDTATQWPAAAPSSWTNTSGSSLATTSSSTQVVTIEDPETALRPDTETEDDFVVESNPFVFSPGHLNKLLNPKSLSTFRSLGGLEGLKKHGYMDYRRNWFTTVAAGTAKSLQVGRLQPGGGALSRPNAEARYQEEIYVEGTVYGTEVEALPDSGADECFISSKLAKRLAVKPLKDTQEVRIANSQIVKSAGVVQIPWAFKGEKKTQPLWCRVLPHCPAGLILGASFLHRTGLLTRFKDRIKKRLTQRWRLPRIQLLGKQQQRLQGTLNGVPVEALPDTGSDLELLSEEGAARLGLDVDRNPAHWIEVQFGDGSIGRTTGVVHDASWAVGGETFYGDFYVLKELSVDVIVGKSYLLDHNAFDRFEGYLVNGDVDSYMSELRNIRYIGGFGESFNLLEQDWLEDVHSPDAFSQQMLMKELARREEIQKLIQELPGHRTAEATLKENERRHHWELLRQRHEDASSQSPPSSSLASSLKATSKPAKIRTSVFKSWRKKRSASGAAPGGSA